MRNFVAVLVTAVFVSFTLLSAHAGTPLFSVEFMSASGEKQSMSIDDDLLQAIGMTEIKTKVVSLNADIRSVRGVLARTLLRQVGASGETATISALDDYQIDVPTQDFEQFDVLIAIEIDGKRLSVRDKGPAWLIYPVSNNPQLDHQLYESRSVWQIKTIEVK